MLQRLVARSAAALIPRVQRSVVSPQLTNVVTQQEATLLTTAEPVTVSNTNGAVTTNAVAWQNLVKAWIANSKAAAAEHEALVNRIYAEGTNKTKRKVLKKHRKKKGKTVNMRRL